MNHRPIRVVPKTNDAPAAAPGLLAHLSDLDDFMIADPTPDFRDWKVVLADGRRVGKVDDVLVDTSTMMVKYIELKVDHDVLLPEVVPGEEDRWLLVPVELAHIDSDAANVVLDRLPAGGLANATRRARGLPTAGEERAILAYYELATAGTERG
ncbi:MAG TPA: PRC-barrel domain-containing protein [Gemmatimonadaceae bacterium]|jgi:hypothetical protein|nr:PRC-barrel domain-containing protein [Gemmatimonadaceae bacterium]